MTDLRLREMLQSDHQGEPLQLGFGESYEMSRDYWLDNYSTLAVDRAVEKYQGERNAAIDEQINGGEIPIDVVRQHRPTMEPDYTMVQQALEIPGQTMDYNGLAAWSNENLDTDYDVDDTAMREAFAADREYVEYRLSNADVWGAGFGSMFGPFKDPSVRAGIGLTFPMSASWGATLPFFMGSGGLIQQALRVGAMESVLAMTAEAPVIVEAQRFQEEMGFEFTGKDVAVNLLQVGGVAGVFAGTTDIAFNLIGRYLRGRLPSDAAGTDEEIGERLVEGLGEVENPGIRPIDEGVVDEVPDWDAMDDDEFMASMQQEFADVWDQEVDGVSFGEASARVAEEERALTKKVEDFITCVIEP